MYSSGARQWCDYVTKMYFNDKTFWLKIKFVCQKDKCQRSEEGFKNRNFFITYIAMNIRHRVERYRSINTVSACHAMPHRRHFVLYTTSHEGR